MFLTCAVSKAIACSAAATALDSGALATTMPFSVAASTSMLSTPVPALPMTFKRRDPSKMSAVTWVLDRMIKPSYSLISCLSSWSVMSVRTSTSKCSLSRSTPSEEIFSFTNTRALSVTSPIMNGFSSVQHTAASRPLRIPKQSVPSTLDLFQYRSHLFTNPLIYDPRASRHVPVLSGLGHRVPHAADPVLMNQINYEFQLVQALEIGDLGLALTLWLRPDTSPNQLRSSSTQDCLLTEKICLCLLLESSLYDTGPGAADTLCVSQTHLLRLSCGVLMDGEKARHSSPVLIHPAHQVSGTLGRNHGYVHVVRRSDLPKVNIEPMGEHEHLAGLQVSAYRIIIDLLLGLVGNENHYHVSALRGLSGSGYIQTHFFSPSPGGRILTQTTDDLHPTVPQGCNSRSMASTLSCAPVTSIIIVAPETSTILDRKTSTICMISGRVCLSAETLIKTNSRSTEEDSSRSEILMTFTSLCSCLVTCSMGCSFPSTDMVMRDILGSCVSPTARPSILNPRRANNPDIRVSTPGLFSTRTDRVCFILLTPEHVTDGSARRHHGHYVGFPLDPTVYYRRAIDLQGLTKYCFNLFQAFNAIAVGTVRLRQFHKVRLAGHAHVAIALIPKQLLPLSDHP